MFQRWLLPGFLYQSVLVGGGYATGRELVEFFLSYGPLGGLLGMLLATAIMSVVAALVFEFARLTGSINYRHFFQALLGKGWFLYEIGYFLLAVLVISVVAAAAGEIAKNAFGIPATAGTLLLCAAIVYLVFRGTGLIERVLAGWSILLYVVYALFIGLFLAKFGGQLGANLDLEPATNGWAVGALEYVGYNMVTLAVILFVAAHFRDRRDTVIAGLLSGPIAMAPALLFYLAMVADYQAVQGEPVPSEYMIRRLDITWLSIIFYITIFGTFIETGTAFIHAINERVAETFELRGWRFSPMVRPLIAVAFLAVSVLLADGLGLVSLIAQGYGMLTWYFIAVFLLPLVTYGLWRIIRASPQPPRAVK
ncbi:MAG: hypothetical protein AAGI11_06660 [Pseudomonadota bacterium]